MLGHFCKALLLHTGTRPWIGLLLGLWSLPHIQASQCQMCGSPNSARYYQTDAWTLETRRFCETCRFSGTVCAVCQLPVRSDRATALGDGRHICTRDIERVILDDAEALRVLHSARKELDRILARYTTLPHTNVIISFANSHQMESSRGTTMAVPGCPTLLGTTRSTHHKRIWKHHITILRGLPAAQMISVYAHELGHAWIHEEVPPRRKLNGSAIEGFCEMLAYRLMEEMGETTQMKRLQLNTYTRGQLNLFVQAYQMYDMNRIFEWAQFGVEPLLRESNPDQIRLIDAPRPTPRIQRSSLTAKSPPPPTALTLTGIMDSAGTSKVALVNGTILSQGESGAVKLGSRTVVVQCLEIRDDRAVLLLLDSNEKVTLLLPPSPH